MESIDYYRVRMVNVLLVVMMLTLAFFTLLDVLVFHLYLVAVSNMIALLVTAVLYFYFLNSLNVRVASLLTVSLLTTAVLLSIIQQAPHYYIFIWITIIPPVSFYLLGIRTGYWISGIFGLFMSVFFVYNHLNSSDETYSVESLNNLVMAYVLLVYFTANFEKSRGNTFNLLVSDIEKRKKAELEIQELNAVLEDKVMQRTRELNQINLKLNEAIVKSNRLREEAEEANRVKSEFLSRMSHQLRTPLNSILGFAQILEMSQLDQAQKRGVTRITSGGKELLRLVDDLLDLNSLEHFQPGVSLTSVLISDIIGKAVEKIKPMAAEKFVAVNLHRTDQNGIEIKTERHMLEKILYNLLDNAVKFNRIGGEIGIEVAVEPGNERHPEMVKIIVSDTGTGIQNEVLPRIFDLFHVGEEAVMSGVNAGLGLPMAKKMTERLGGTIGVESQEGVGSRFWIQIPFNIDESTDLNRKNPL